MAEVKLTAQQQMAVDNRGGQLLVSAAAGSGKTKVLVERLFSYLRQGANVDDFLIITYTKAAASELRGKIATELLKQVAREPENIHLRRQMFRVYQADIKTVDAFCVGILRQNTHMLSCVKEHTITPDFRVLDEKETLLLRQRVLERTLEEFYDTMDEADAFLAETLGAGRDDRNLCAMVLELHEKIQSHPYPMEWLENVKKSWQNLPQELSQTPFGRILMEDAVRKATFWAQQLELATDLCSGDEKLQTGYEDRFLEVAEQLRLFEKASTQGWDAVAAIRPAFRRMGNAPESPEKMRLQGILKHSKEAIKSITEVFSVSQEQHLEDLRAMAPAMVALLDLTAQFSANYQAEKVRRNVMDFSDQEHYAIDLLRKENAPTDLAKSLSSKYSEVMVDEYQDSNAVQDCIFRSVSCEGEKLFCVGDVKQSIYRFRLADPGIFLQKYLTYPDAKEQPDGPRRVVLSQNFRSRHEVLDVTNFVMGAILSPEMGEMAYGDEEKLYLGAEYYLPRKDCDAEFHFVDVQDTEEQQFDRQEVEARFVAKRICQLLDEGYPVQEGDHFRPCTPDDMVILMRSPRSRLKSFTEALQRRGIPCASSEKSGFFDTVEIAVLFSLLQVVDNPRQDVPLISVLRSPLFGFTADDLAVVRSLQIEGNFYDALLLDERECSRSFLENLRELRQLSREEPVDVFLWQIYCRMHILSVFSAMPGGMERRQNLLALYEYARQSTAMGVRSIFDFVTQLRQLMENDQTPAVCTRGASGGVQIMSIHKSKGLEFPIVILCDLNKRFDKRDQQRPVLVHQELGLGTERVEPERHIRYDTVSKTAVAMTLLRESKSEEMRILYVAMTRAKEKLIMVDCMKKGCRHLRDLYEVAGCAVEPEVVASAKAMGDWILLPLLCTAQGGTLREYAGCDAPLMVPGPAGLTVQVWNNPDIGAEERKTVQAEEKAEDGFDPACLEWEYPYQRASITPTKITATQLKGREVDQEIADGTRQLARKLTFEKPAFLRETMGLNSAEKGTAIHLCMQYLDFAMPATQEAVDGFVKGLLEKRLLNEAQEQAVDRRLLLEFLHSPLCKRIAASEEVYREYRFSLLVDAQKLYDGAVDGEQMMLQGVVDCAFVEDGRLVIVDFKTDHIMASEVSERAENYRPQLQAYSHAMEQVMEKEVGEKLLYFFAVNSAISL